ncbi:Metallo-dependent phosphatase [Obba rivulosa]|uniref:Metallo-dependent phosphatase n=1 Tax=Obba rivulosa TaxID=1052685 RepID=A0A8E2AK99_9APHY|nr:Metallo-dependent phosphatase [Obba rivulosa]
MPLLHRPRGAPGGQSATHRAIPFVLCAVFIFGLVYELQLAPTFGTPRLTATKQKDRYKFPDFNRYIHSHTVNAAEIGLDDPDKRAILIGDVHGMNKSLHNLLDTLNYSPTQDTLILAGDMLAKSTHAGSLAVLDFLAQHEPCASTSRSPTGTRTPAPNPKPRLPPARGRVYAVRGNHDHMVVQWRAWREWFTALELALPVPGAPEQTGPDGTLAGKPVGTGQEFLALIEKEWERDVRRDPQGASDADEWADVARKRAVGTWRAEWWFRIPEPGKGRAKKDWHMFTDHYWLAKGMTQEQARCLFSLPLVLHVPEEHFFVVHGGLLPSDPRRPATDERQPLAHPPDLDLLPEDVFVEDDLDLEGTPLLTPSTHRDFAAIAQHIIANSELSGAVKNASEELLHVAQERAVLRDIPQNRDAWVLLNMRGVRKSGKVTRDGDRGTPWSDVWNRQMDRCAGFDAGAVDDSEPAPRRGRFGSPETYAHGKDEADVSSLPCLPSTVVYGHAASRGLDDKRWTVGLDTGCLYGRKLTALVLRRGSSSGNGAAEDDEDDEEEEEEEEEIDDGADVEYSGSRLVRRRKGTKKNEKKHKTWRRRIEFGDERGDVRAELVSVKCPKTGNLS